ncbi:MAG: argininosuccinate lyase [Anaerolineae bacterium]|nr:argininosuccinate lyase [Anaerolineae bacterium]
MEPWIESEMVRKFTASVNFDRRLYREDIRGSKAHVKMLAQQGLLSPEEAEAILRELEKIQEEIEKGEFRWKEEYEDLHLNIEAALIERLGETGAKLHTGRSRNDQIALDMRLYVREAAGKICEAITRVQEAIVDLAENHMDAIMPGYTHLQKAQPVLFSHHIMAYFWMLERDKGRFRDALQRADECPLGAGALAGSTLPLDPEFVARELGFSRSFHNSMDAVSDRDFILEFLSACSILMVHLSRLAEELILWSTREFGFIELAVPFTTGSSMMPQKRNPDVAELIRAKAGRVFGHLMALLTVLKGLPLAYNRDLQEDKEGLFDAVDTVLACLEVLAPMLRSIEVKKERAASEARDGFLLATDMAEYLVARGMPFRQAHAVVRKIAEYCRTGGKDPQELKVEELRAFSELFGEDFMEGFTAEASTRARRAPGCTSPERVKEQILEAKQKLKGG